MMVLDDGWCSCGHLSLDHDGDGCRAKRCECPRFEERAQATAADPAIGSGPVDPLSGFGGESDLYEGDECESCLSYYDCFPEEGEEKDPFPDPQPATTDTAAGNVAEHLVALLTTASLEELDRFITGIYRTRSRWAVDALYTEASYGGGDKVRELAVRAAAEEKAYRRFLPFRLRVASRGLALLLRVVKGVAWIRARLSPP
jgi:hypothetical protein